MKFRSLRKVLNFIFCDFCGVVSDVSPGPNSEFSKMRFLGKICDICISIGFLMVGPYLTGPLFLGLFFRVYELFYVKKFSMFFYHIIKVISFFSKIFIFLFINLISFNLLLLINFIIKKGGGRSSPFFFLGLKKMKTAYNMLN
uniref:Uncharacterized protein n=1 Tax=Heterorhabditis bacteriophora TaxID=37862 RepID=A0A1I7WKQ5_HETBA